MEPWFNQLEHHVTLAGIVIVLGVGLNQHKIWTRMKDRINQLWYRHCDATGDKYEPLENGKH